MSYETILAQMLNKLTEILPGFTALVESDPAYVILEAAAWREFLIRQKVNEQVKAITLAYATGSDLDHLASRYDVERLLLDAGDDTALPPVPPTYEDDESLRARVQLSFEGFSTAGPAGAYQFHARGSDPDVQDAAVASLGPGNVTVVILSRTGTGVASAGVLAAVSATLQNDDVRPLTDSVVVQTAVIKPYSISATVYTDSGPDSSVVLANVQASASEFVSASRRLGRAITISAIYAALHQPGVRRVVLAQPVVDVNCAWNEAGHCTAINLVNGGAGD